MKMRRDAVTTLYPDRWRQLRRRLRVFFRCTEEYSTLGVKELRNNLNNNYIIKLGINKIITYNGGGWRSISKHNYNKRSSIPKKNHEMSGNRPLFR